MFTVRANTTVVGISELRTQWKKIREAMRHGRVEVAMRNRPEAVLLLREQYDAMEQLFERLEDYALAIEALGREQTVKPGDYLSLEKALKKFA
jgi:hypothetical protein